MTIYILTYNDGEDHRFYLPTKKAALQFIADEKVRFPTTHDITDVEIIELKGANTKAGIADLLNAEVGTGY